MSTRQQQLVDAIRTWPLADQLEWRRLCETDPKAAVLMAELALELGARPVPDPVATERSPRMRLPERRAPEEALELRRRMRASTITEGTST